MMQTPFDLHGHVATVTGANHGIGTATARTLAACGADVLVSYLLIADPGHSGIPETYRRNRASNAEHVLAAVADSSGHAIALEADLADAATTVRLFDVAEAQFGHVDILVNNATGWLADTFTAKPRDRFGHPLVRVSTQTFDLQFAVDGMLTFDPLCNIRTNVA